MFLSLASLRLRVTRFVIFMNKKVKDPVDIVRRTKWIAAIAACLGVSLFSTIAIAHGGKKMDPLYDINEAAALAPQTHKIGGLFGGYSNISIFPVPQDNSVGSNDMGNAITIISFPKGKIDQEKYFRTASDISGGGKYLPVISPDLIGFGQVRVFHTFDFKRKIYRKYPIVFPVSQYIDNTAIADARQRHFLFEIESQKENPKNSFDVDKSLQLVDLTGEKPVLIKEFKKEPGTVWTTTKDRILLYRILERELLVLNMNLEPSHHPLEDVIKQYKDILNPFKEKIGFSRMRLHPSLPFAVLYGGYRGSTFISWSKNSDNKPHLLIDYTTQFSFSPDGKWVVYQKKHPEPKMTYIMPVSEKYPHYLGTPILFSNDSFEVGQGAWTTNPTVFVSTKLDKIFRWDLENQEFPEKGNMSFHDYIVQEDLKKLTREKKQGLGK